MRPVRMLAGVFGFLGMVVALTGICAGMGLLFSPWPWATIPFLVGGAALWVGSWSAFEWSTEP